MSNDEMRQYYRDRAPEYEQIYYRDVPERQRELKEEADRLERLAEGKRVLELACGTGFWTQVMSRTASEIVALDVSREMIAEARKKNLSDSVRFMVSDLYDSPPESETFDIVALGFWFSHHPRQDFDQLFDVLNRGVKRNGLIWIIDNNPPAEGSINTSVRVDEHGNNYKRRKLDNGREFVILKNYFSRQELETLFGERFVVKNLVYGLYYWSAVLAPRN